MKAGTKVFPRSSEVYDYSPKAAGFRAIFNRLVPETLLTVAGWGWEFIVKNTEPP